MSILEIGKCLPLLAAADEQEEEIVLINARAKVVK